VFESRAAARAYLDEAIRLHRLSRASLGKNRHTGPDAAVPLAAGDVDAQQLRAYVLVPPSMQLSLKLLAGSDKAARPLPLPPPPRDAGGDQPRLRRNTGPFEELAERARNGPAGEEPWSSGPAGASSADDRKVLVVLDGGKLTVDAVRAAIDMDGTVRNLAWRLGEGEENIQPTRKLISPARRHGPGADNRTAEEKSAERFGRFLVTFAESAEARRFVRGWHKRGVYDDRTERTVIVNATALW
jgi:hypothetical protein